MRIVAGAWRGRALAAPPGTETRPTADRVRQALFDILMHAPWWGPDRMAGASVLDLFAGTGALGLEALSRGAAHALFVENAPAALRVLRANIAACRAEDRCAVLAADARALPKGAPADLIFLDPPYHQDLVGLAMDGLRRSGRAAAGTLVVAETARDEPAPDVDPILERLRGPARLTIWREGQAPDRADGI